jgi:hypothetical protein
MRLRLKVWTDKATGKRYLMPVALMKSRDSDVMRAYAMSEEETKFVELSTDEWNTLPFFYFKEDGEAPRHTTRAPDEIKL